MAKPRKFTEEEKAIILENSGKINLTELSELMKINYTDLSTLINHNRITFVSKRTVRVREVGESIVMDKKFNEFGEELLTDEIMRENAYL